MVLDHKLPLVGVNQPRAKPPWAAVMTDDQLSAVKLKQSLLGKLLEQIEQWNGTNAQYGSRLSRRLDQLSAAP